MTAGPDRTTTGAPPVPPPPPASRPGAAGAAPSGTREHAPGAAASPPGADSPTAERPFGRPVPTSEWGWFARIPLRARLVAITVLLLAAGLGLASVVTTTVVSSHLVDQVDAQLERSAEGVASSTIRQTPASATLPSDYYVLVRDLEGNVISESMVEHVYLIEGGLIKNMEIKQP